MKTLVLTWLLATLAAANAAAAKLGDAESPAPLGAPGCDLTGYQMVARTLSPAFLVPDNHHALSAVDELATVANADTLREVTLEVSLAHTWMGDLVLRLEYVDCVSGVPLYGADILCRPRGANLLPPSPCGSGTSAGCSGNLGTSALSTPPPEPATYFFSDSASVPLGDGSCPSLAGPGCYLPTSPGAFAGFRGHLLGGCWRLSVADWAESDVGMIDHWAVWMAVTPEVATRATSWGRLKTIYR